MRDKRSRIEVSRYDTHGVDQNKYVAIGRIFDNEPFKKKYPVFDYSGTRYAEVKRNTVDKIKGRMEKSAWADVSEFYHSNRIYLIALGDVEFGEIDGLKPLINHIDCVTEYKNGVQFVSFVVLRETFKKYIQMLDTTPFDKIDLPRKENPRANYGRDSNLYRNYQMVVDGRRFECDKTPMVDKFAIWCETNGVSKTEATGKALELLFQAYPLDVPLVREPDFFDLLPPVSMQNMVQSDGIYQGTLYLPTNIYARLRDIFTNYNRAPENGNNKKMTLTEFFLTATKYFLDNNKDWTLKYGNPELYAELKKNAELAKYNSEQGKE